MKVSLILMTFSAIVLLAKSKRKPKFAPYGGINLDLAGMQSKYGLKSVSLAFAFAKNGCHPVWNGVNPINDTKALVNVKAFKASGGDLIVTFGGFINQKDYIEHNCKTVEELAGAYKLALDAVGSTHLDLDIERIVPNDLLSEAVALLQKKNPAITFSLTTGSTITGFSGQGYQILKSAIQHGVNVDMVNVMTMDHNSPKTWGDHIKDIGDGCHKLLKQLFPIKSDNELYSIIGFTPMLGKNDQGKYFTLNDAREVVAYAKSKAIGHLAFWKLERDNGNCAGHVGAPSNECSGIAQKDHEFTQIFVQFEK